MPVGCFNSPDGWYASVVTNASRVTEFKQLVDALHRAGLKVIMDVVYNHTAEDCGNELNVDARFSFNGLVPRYYYRNCINTPVSHSGHSTCARNGSDGHGNDDKCRDQCGLRGGMLKGDRRMETNCGNCVVCGVLHIK
jgi:Alpha amylase, catalytic domain